MDGGGCLDQPLRRSGLRSGDQAGTLVDRRKQTRARSDRGRRLRLSDWLQRELPAWFGAALQRSKRFIARIVRLPPPRGAGIAASLLLLAAAIGYGIVAGQHMPAVIDWAKDARDAAANSVGFRIAAVALSGNKEVSREEILTTAGVTGRASLLFLDADAARARLMANPWIADAAVLKLYPDRLQITITERQAFALWQKNGRIKVVADDGTVLEPFVERRYLRLPLVVGEDAEHQAKDFLDILARYPDIAGRVRASVLVAQRRWDLVLDNGIDVELPETNPAAALGRLVTLDHDKKLLSRDITIVDLRLLDRVTVRLSDAAAQAREEAIKASQKQRKGGNA